MRMFIHRMRCAIYTCIFTCRQLQNYSDIYVIGKLNAHFFCCRLKRLMMTRGMVLSPHVDIHLDH